MRQLSRAASPPSVRMITRSARTKPRGYTSAIALRVRGKSGESILKKRVRLLISGQVQGVWFRMSTKEQADRLGVSGWVRNRRSGHVEVIAEGEEAAIDALVAWCKVGSEGARVARVDITHETFSGELDGFVVERTV